MSKEQDSVYEDFCKCYELANRLDAFDPEAPGAFTGTVSERLVRAFDRLLLQIEARDEEIHKLKSDIFDPEHD